MALQGIRLQCTNGELIFNYSKVVLAFRLMCAFNLPPRYSSFNNCSITTVFKPKIIWSLVTRIRIIEKSVGLWIVHLLQTSMKFESYCKTMQKNAFENSNCHLCTRVNCFKPMPQNKIVFFFSNWCLLWNLVMRSYIGQIHARYHGCYQYDMNKRNLCYQFGWFQV